MCALGRMLCRCHEPIARRCRCNRRTAGYGSGRLRAVCEEASSFAGKISPSACKVGQGDPVFDVIENCDSIGRSSFRFRFELVGQRKCNFDGVFELLYCFVGEIRDDRWHLALLELLDKLLCFVGISFEGTNFFAENFRKINADYLRAKKAFD